MSTLLHIASLVVHHRPEIAAELDRLIAHHPLLELALRRESRSVLLCEAESESAVMQSIDAIGQLAGVMSVNLVHHHAEARDYLMEEIIDGYTP
jgi:nitrate reductase NapAB chaperone NapD